MWDSTLSVYFNSFILTEHVNLSWSPWQPLLTGFKESHLSGSPGPQGLSKDVRVVATQQGVVAR